MATYLDFAATTPVDPRVAEVVQRYMVRDFGNAGSRTHTYGRRAKKAVLESRETLATLAGFPEAGVVFTSGATEANNLALLGLRRWASAAKRTHVIATAIEHKAVLEPIRHLEDEHGWEVTLLRPGSQGWVDPTSLVAALRPDTGLVSIMHVNNETGIVQPLQEMANVIGNHDCYFHVDAAQGFGKIQLRYPDRVDMLSISGHKLFAPQGIGALLLRRRESGFPPLVPLMFGGGQQRALRPGTLAVPLIAGLGSAVELADAEFAERSASTAAIKNDFLQQVQRIPHTLAGDQSKTVPHIVNVAFHGLDSEAAMVLLKNQVALSNGSACTSATYSPSHVLEAMDVPSRYRREALRISWSHGSGSAWISPLLQSIEMVTGN